MEILHSTYLVIVKPLLYLIFEPNIEIRVKLLQGVLKEKLLISDFIISIELKITFSQHTLFCYFSSMANFQASTRVRTRYLLT